MLSFEERLAERKAQFKSTELNCRRRRESDAVQLRKANRDSALLKRRLVEDVDQENAPVETRPLPELVAELQAGAPRLEATRALRRLLGEDDKVTAMAVAAGCVPELVKSLQDRDPAVQHEACWALTNIASGASEQAFAVVMQDGGRALPALVALMLQGTTEVQEQAAWCLGNVAGDCEELRGAVLAAGALPPLLQLVVASEAHLPALRNATWALRNLCRGGLPEAQAACVAPILGCLVRCPDLDVLTETLWALVFLCDNEQARHAVASGGVGTVAALLEHADKAVVKPALRVCGALSSGTDEETATLLECGVLPRLRPLLGSPDAAIRKDTVWLLSNVAAGTPAQVQHLLDECLLEEMLPLASSGDWNVRRESVWAVTNAILSGSTPQVQAIATLGAVPVLCSHLASTDPDVLLCVLNALRSLLAAGAAEAEEFGTANWPAQQVEESGMEALEELLAHSDERVLDSAGWLYRLYFEEEEEEAFAESAPSTAGLFAGLAPAAFNFA